MNKLQVTNIQKLCVHDGPGVRTIVFLQGCSLQCPWCCNPEAIHINTSNLYDKGTCTYPVQKIYCKDCEKFGGKHNLSTCPVQAYESVSKPYSPQELLDELLGDEYIYAEGGVTFSGGEPLLQIEALIPVLQELKKKKVSIAFETALYVPEVNLESALEYIDYWVVDLKFQFGYVENKEFYVPQNSVCENLKLLQEQANLTDVTYRMVMMHEVIKNIDSIVEKLKDHNIANIELLMCHSLAENKYRQLGLEFHKFMPLTEADMMVVQSKLDIARISYNYLRI